MSLNGVPDASVLLQETVWLDVSKLQDAEARYEEHLANVRRGDAVGQGDISAEVITNHIKQEEAPKPQALPTSSLASEIAIVRSRIQNLMKANDSNDSFPGQVLDRLQQLEQENAEFRKSLTNICGGMQEMLQKINALEIKVSSLDSVKKEPEHRLTTEMTVVDNGTTAEDDDMDLFGSDEETEEDRRIKEERLKAYESKKAKKTQVIAKSSVVLDVKPWSDETDMQEMEKKVKKIECVGLKWGAAKLVPLAYGIKKLQIIAIVEDDNCSIDWLQEQIEAIEDSVQSVDIAAFNKL